MDQGINKPFDRFAKDFADEAPRLFLQLAKLLPEGAKIDIKDMRPETAPSVVMPDYIATVVVETDRPFIFHIEFQLLFHRDVPKEVTRRASSLAMQHNIRVKSFLVLLDPKRAPDVVPDFGELEWDDTYIRHKYAVGRVWEMDPGPILKSGDLRFLPWAVLMNTTEEEVRWIASKIARSGDEDLIGRFLTIGSIRYDRSVLEEMLGGPRMGLVEAIMEGSSLVREAKEEAAKQGRQEGRQEGRAAEARVLLRRALNVKFPALGVMPEIDAIASLDALESLLISGVLPATDSAAVAAAIRKAASGAN